MNTEAQRRASAEFVAKRKAAGWRKATFWISPGVWSELERLKAVHGTRDKALEAMLMGSGRSEPATTWQDMERGHTSPPKTALLKKPAVPYGSRLKKPKGSKP